MSTVVAATTARATLAERHLEDLERRGLRRRGVGGKTVSITPIVRLLQRSLCTGAS